MNITEKITHTAAPYQAVAFDVFDTLLKRDVARPTDLFALQGTAFANARQAAEAQARAAKQGEVTLAEIYAQSPLTGYDPAVECRWELQAATANAPVLQAARLCHARGQKVYAVSDMYLPQEQIEAMLRRCGYDFLDGVFVSCTYGVQKRSGKLFRVFLQQTGLAAGQVLFVGDSWRADVLGGALGGVRALHLPTATPPQGPGGNLWAFTQSRLLLQPNAAAALGFAALGPLAVAFAHWLHGLRLQYPGAKLWFLARDMYLVRQIYQGGYPQDDNTGYLQVSRRSLCPLLLAQQNWPLLCRALPRQVLSGAQLAAYCGAPCPADKRELTFDLKHGGCTAELTAFLAALPAPAQGAGAVQAYLQAQGIKAGDILVDIGSGGTTQCLLEALCGVPLQGAYLACDARLAGALPAERCTVFLFNGQPTPTAYWAAQPVLERLLSQDVGATIGYTAQGEPILQAAEPNEIVAQIQGGALRFAKAWQGSVLAGQAIPPDEAIAPFLHLMQRPTAAQAALLGDLTVEDGGCYPVAAPAAIRRYLRHPGQLKADFSAARWKVGFLKRLLPLPLPYGALYRAFKK